MGCCYNHGSGVDVNIEKAFELYKIAAEGGNSSAQKSLASLYEQGKGTEKDINSAFYWYSKAFENGCQEIKDRLDRLSKQQQSDNGNYTFLLILILFDLLLIHYY